MKILFAFFFTIVWSSTAVAFDAAEKNQYLQEIRKAEDLLVKGELAESNILMRNIAERFENDRTLAGLCKMAALYLELEKPRKARVYISRLQIMLLGQNHVPRYMLKLAASYLQAGRTEEASMALDDLVGGMPVYHQAIAEDVKMIQAFIDLDQEPKAVRAMVLLDRKLADLERSKEIRTSAALN